MFVCFTLQDSCSRCCYCSASYETAIEVIQHTIRDRPEEKVAFYLPSTCVGKAIKYKKRTFSIIGKDIKCDIASVQLDLLSNKLHIPTRNVDSSPVHKLFKVNTPSKNVKKQLFGTDVHECEEAIPEEELEKSDQTEPEQITVDRDELVEVVKQLQNLLPAVTDHLKEHGRLEEWIVFFNLISAGNFSVDHIASQLFFDVVKFHQNRSIFAMRFNKEVKQFWSIGLQLFHAQASHMSFIPLCAELMCAFKSYFSL